MAREVEPILPDPKTFISQSQPHEIIRDETVLQEAERIVSGSRQTEYGPPEDSFTAIGRVWGALLQSAYSHSCEDLPPRLVATMLVAFKCVRDAHNPKRDNLVDMAGYARCAEMFDTDAF